VLQVRLVCPRELNLYFHPNQLEWLECFLPLISRLVQFLLLEWWEILLYGYCGFTYHINITYISNTYVNQLWNQSKAITDLSSGEIMYLIDDNGGSEIYIIFFNILNSFYGAGSNFEALGIISRVVPFFRLCIWVPHM